MTADWLEHQSPAERPSVKLTREQVARLYEVALAEGEDRLLWQLKLWGIEVSE